MKKIIFLLTGLFMAHLTIAKPAINKVVAPSSVGVFDLYEIAFQLPGYDNPYDPEVIEVYADFLSPGGTSYRVIGFYYEGYTFMEQKGVEVAARNGADDSWRIRFTPNEVGKWSYVIHAVDRTGEEVLATRNGKALAFDCQARDAEGFIRKANSRYLKREAFAGGRRQDHAFFPVGPNVAWYQVADYYRFRKPFGIYDYERYIDSLSGNANYMRIWICRFQYLALYGPEHAIRDKGKPMMFFDSSLNQKDAAELDHIVSYAAAHDIALMPCFFSFGDFSDESETLRMSEQNDAMPSSWKYNPYHTVLKLKRPADFFSDPEALRITGNYIRYIVARWGYATNIQAWELWNEVCNMFKKTELQGDEVEAILQWHRKMAALIRSCDPHQHLITTSLGGYAEKMEPLEKRVFEDLDVAQDHFYDNIQKARLRFQMPQMLLDKASAMRNHYPQKPFFMGEYGMNATSSGVNYEDRDPRGVDLHNSLWASLFSGAMGPASFWYWRVLDQYGLFGRFKPVAVFSKELPVLSDDFTPVTNGVIEGKTITFPDNLQMYYLVSPEEDTLYGWCQDVAFAYQSLRRLTDVVGENLHFENDGVRDPKGYVYTLNSSLKPQAEFRSDTVRIPIAKQSRGTRYLVRWYDTETGLEIPSAATEARVRYRLFRGTSLSFAFPKALKEGRTYTNTFGDAVFVITKMTD